MKETIVIPIWRKQNLTVEEAAAYSNIGVNKIREMIKSPFCDYALYIGKRVLIKREAFDDFIRRVNEV